MLLGALTESSVCLSLRHDVGTEGLRRMATTSGGLPAKKAAEFLRQLADKFESGEYRDLTMDLEQDIARGFVPGDAFYRHQPVGRQHLRMTWNSVPQMKAFHEWAGEMFEIEHP